jgi:hypothetical protein
MNDTGLKQRFMTMAALTEMVTADNIHGFILARSLVDGVPGHWEVWPNLVSDAEALFVDFALCDENGAIIEFSSLDPALAAIRAAGWGGLVTIDG